MRLRLLRAGAALREEACSDGSCRMPESHGIVSVLGLVWDQVAEFQREAG